jgi:hypothetical protein
MICSVVFEHLKVEKWVLVRPRLGWAARLGGLLLVPCVTISMNTFPFIAPVRSKKDDGFGHAVDCFAEAISALYPYSAVAKTHLLLS